MSNKRFTLIECNGNIEDEYEQKVYDGGEDIYELLDLLNELSEERDYFKKKKCEYFNKWNLSHLDNINLRKENKQLKQRIRQLELSCECQAEFIFNKGFDIRDVAEFARRSNNDREYKVF